MSDFRDSKNRAVEKTRDKTIVTPISYFIDRVVPGDTVWGYMFPQKGVLKDIIVSIELSNKDEMDFKVEVLTDYLTKDIDLLFKVGDNKIDQIPVEKGDKFLLKARTVKDRDFVINNMFISFNFITGKIK